MIFKTENGAAPLALFGDVSIVERTRSVDSMIDRASTLPLSDSAAAESDQIGTGSTAIVYAGDYLNKLTGESVERECRRKMAEGATQLIVNFSKTELVNSIGVSILLGVIDAARSNGASVAFADVNEDTAELFEMLGLTNHVRLLNGQ